MTTSSSSWFCQATVLNVLFQVATPGQTALYPSMGSSPLCKGSCLTFDYHQNRIFKWNRTIFKWGEIHFLHPATSATHSRSSRLLAPCCSNPLLPGERTEILAESACWHEVPSVPRPGALATAPQGLPIAVPLIRKGGDVSSRVLQRRVWDQKSVGQACCNSAFFLFHPENTRQLLATALPKQNPLRGSSLPSRA